MNFTEEDVLSIVDACFDAYASSYRNEAKEYALQCLEKHKSNSDRTDVMLKCADCGKEAKTLNKFDEDEICDDCVWLRCRDCGAVELSWVKVKNNIAERAV